MRYTNDYGQLRGPWLALGYLTLALLWAAVIGGLVLLCLITV